jgi:hypothetical protein
MGSRYIGPAPVRPPSFFLFFFRLCYIMLDIMDSRYVSLGQVSSTPLRESKQGHDRELKG